MAITSLAVLSVIMGLIFLAFMWSIIRRYRQRMLVEGKNPSPGVSVESYPGNKRRHERTNICWPVRIENQAGTVAGAIKNISLSGSFVICEKPLALKERFTLTIEAPGQEPRSLLAEVVWSNANVPEDRVVNRGMGVRFIHNSEEACRAFQAAVLDAAMMNDPLPRAAGAGGTV